MFTRPDDLGDDAIVAGLAAYWDFEPVEVGYLPVGFGSHHWRAVTRTGEARFVTVDDLWRDRRSTAAGTADAAFARLDGAFRAARALGVEAGLDFVIAPIVGADDAVLARLDDRYAMVVHPYLDGPSAGEDGEYRSADDRLAVLHQVVALHGATAAAPHAGVEEGFLPGRPELCAALETVDEPWPAGPYGEPARALLREHARGVRALLAHYDRLVDGVCSDGTQMVLTHGEPHASNVVVTARGPRLVDWESALLAPLERDLWVLDPGDGSMLAAYAETTGTQPRGAYLDFYRLWYDLFEIAGYVALFRGAHAATADAAESWKNLVEFLQPEARWPELFG